MILLSTVYGNSINLQDVLNRVREAMTQIGNNCLGLAWSKQVGMSGKDVGGMTLSWSTMTQLNYEEGRMSQLTPFNMLMEQKKFALRKINEHPIRGILMPYFVPIILKKLSTSHSLEHDLPGWPYSKINHYENGRTGC